MPKITFIVTQIGKTLEFLVTNKSSGLDVLKIYAPIHTRFIQTSYDKSTGSTDFAFADLLTSVTHS